MTQRATAGPLPTLLDRDAELARLGEAWGRTRSGTPQLGVVWGRRRVGKTFLVAHFVRGKRALFHAATQQSEGIELARLTEAMTRDLGPHAVDLSGGGFRDWEAALRFFVALARDEPLAVVIDEAPYLARSTPGFASIVQAVWDRVPQGTKLLLVLTGSAVGFIEAMLGPRGALRGRPTLALRLDPLDLVAARAFLPRASAAQLVEAYAACGGYPLHLLQWDASAPTPENLHRLAFSAAGILIDDAAAMLREELPETGGYARILAAIGRGRARFSEIAADAGQRVEQPLDTLVRVGLVRKALPIGAPRAARPSYELTDPYLAFWFSVLYSDIAHVESGQGPAVLRRRWPQWMKHLGWVFEEAARAHARRLVAGGGLPADLIVGRWWAASGEPCELDVLGLRGATAHLFGEARWQERPLGGRDLRQLKRKVGCLGDVSAEPLLALWGRGGVDRASVDRRVLGFDVEQVVAT